MTPFPHFIEADASLRQARELMHRHDIRHIPVKQTGRLVGVITDRDIKRALDPDLGLPSSDELVVGDVAVFDGYVVEVDEPLDLVLMHMADEHIGCALVTRSGRLAGIFTTTDACRVFAEHLRGEHPSPRDDEAA
jgi:acetoin utilization protein AcuB